MLFKIFASLIMYVLLRYTFIFIGFFLFGEGEESLMYSVWYYVIPLIIQILGLLLFYQKRKLTMGSMVVITMILLLVFIVGFFNLFPDSLGFLNSPK